jgi:hypothetical protein
MTFPEYSQTWIEVDLEGRGWCQEGRSIFGSVSRGSLGRLAADDLKPHCSGHGDSSSCSVVSTTCHVLSHDGPSFSDGTSPLLVRYEAPHGCFVRHVNDVFDAGRAHRLLSQLTFKATNSNYDAETDKHKANTCNSHSLHSILAASKRE